MNILKIAKRDGKHHNKSGLTILEFAKSIVELATTKSITTNPSTASGLYNKILGDKDLYRLYKKDDKDSFIQKVKGKPRSFSRNVSGKSKLAFSREVLEYAQQNQKDVLPYSIEKPSSLSKAISINKKLLSTWEKDDIEGAVNYLSNKKELSNYELNADNQTKSQFSKKVFEAAEESGIDLYYSNYESLAKIISVGKDASSSEIESTSPLDAVYISLYNYWESGDVDSALKVIVDRSEEMGDYRKKNAKGKNRFNFSEEVLQTAKKQNIEIAYNTVENIHQLIGSTPELYGYWENDDIQSSISFLNNFKKPKNVVTERPSFEQESSGGKKSRSWHEVIIRDILFFIGESFEYEPSYLQDLQDNPDQSDVLMDFVNNVPELAKQFAKEFYGLTDEQLEAQVEKGGVSYQTRLMEPDFLLSDGHFFEVFGGRNPDKFKEVFKIKHFPNLKYIVQSSLKKARTGGLLTSYANALDTQSCSTTNCEGSDCESDCGMLLSYSIVQRIEEISPLLSESGVQLDIKYVDFLKKAFVSADEESDEDKAKKETRLQEMSQQIGERLNWEYYERYSMYYGVPFDNWISNFYNKSNRAPSASEVYEAINSNFLELAPSYQWQKTEAFVKNDRPKIMSISNITRDLTSQGFWSAFMWSDLDKVAVYYKTEENWNQAMEDFNPQNQNQIIESPNFQEQRLVSNNWYECKTASESSEDPTDWDLLPDSLPDEDIEYEEQLMRTDPKTGKDITYIRKNQVEHILDQFIVDKLSGATLSKRFSVDFESGTGEPKTTVGMRMVNHPYTKYNIQADDRRMLSTAIREKDQMALYEFFNDNDISTLKRKKKPRGSRLNYNPNRSRRTRYPVTKMQETRDKHGMVGVFDLSKAKQISQDLQADYGALLQKDELELLKSIAVTDAYINIYPNRVSVIRGNGQVWVVDDATANEFNVPVREQNQAASTDWYVVEAARTSYVPVREYIDRLKSIGWEVSIHPRSSSHITAVAPAGKGVGIVGFSHNKTNWEKHWQNQKEDLMHISRDLEFVFMNPFMIPEGFDKMTLQIEEKPLFVEKLIYFNQLRNTLLKDITIFVNGVWEQPEIVDHTDGSLMFDNENIRTYRPNDQVLVKVPNK